MPTIIAMTKTKDAARIGNNFAQSTWYSLKKITDVELSKGDEVEMKYEKEGRENVITEISVTGKAPAQTPDAPAKKEWRSKSPEESDCIRRQAVGKMVAESVKALKDFSSTEDLIASIEIIFKTYDELTK